MELHPIDATKICRICCQDGGFLISVFSLAFSHNFTIAEIITMTTNIQITESDGLPEFICNNCAYRVEMVNEFKELCTSSDLRLRRLFGISNFKIDNEQTVDGSLTKNDPNCGSLLTITVPSITDSSTQVKDEEIYAAMNVVCNFMTELPSTSSHQEELHSQPEIIHLQTQLPVGLAGDGTSSTVVLNEQVLADVDEIIINQNKDETSATTTTTTNDPHILSVENLTGVTTSSSFNTVTISNGIEILPRTGSDGKQKDPDQYLKPLKKRKSKHSKSNLDTLLIKHQRKQKESRTQSKPKGIRSDRLLLRVPDQCFECGKIFAYSGYLELHMRMHTGERPHECTVCQRKFSQPSNLVLHMRTHTGERPYQCEICSKTFTTGSNLITHQRIHSDLREFVCSVCTRAFRSQSELSSHEGTHTGIKNRICKVCGKAFYKTSYLNAHLRTVHIGEKKYRCAECGKEFSNNSNLTCHFRIHTGEKPYACPYCTARFNQSSAMLRHKNKQHSNMKGIITHKIDERAVDVEDPIKNDHPGNSQQQIYHLLNI